MKSSKNRTPKLLYAIVACLILLLVSPIVVIGVYVSLSREHTSMRQHGLIYQTNHAAILAACREMLLHKRDYGDHQHPGSASEPVSDYIVLDSDDRRLPAVIRHFKPATITIKDDSVEIEMGGGFFHYGLTAFAQGAVSELHHKDLGGTRRLIPGLWYDWEEGVGGPNC